MRTPEVGCAGSGSADGAAGGSGFLPKFLGFPGSFQIQGGPSGAAPEGGRGPLLLALLLSLRPGRARGRRGRRRLRLRHRGRAHLAPARIPKIPEFPGIPGIFPLVPSDGVGIVTRIGFVWLQGSHLDCEAKQWRFVADLLNDVALVLEILAPYWLSFGPALLVMAAAARCVVGVAGGATRAALAVHQARRDNVADVAAKDSSQETLVNGAGLLLSLLLLPLLDGRPWLTWATLVLLLIGHLTFNLAAIGSLTLTSLNRPRLRLAIGWALRGGGAAGERGVACPGVGGAKLEVPRPEQVNPREPLLPGLGSRLRLHLGAPLELLASSEAELRKALECGSPDYIVVIRPSQSWVGVGLRRGAPPEASILGCAHALTLEQLLGPPMDTGTPLGRKLEPLQRKIRNCPPGAVPWGVLAETSRLFRDLGPALLRGLEAAGWDVRRPLLAVDEWRLEWAEPTAGHAPS
ncbi:RUS family member 1 isoform X2 [Zonotrichia albicollis]|uniref:RUS family member 1 isoform X2 n=1 Tax=Zonotrichia albicollis TaxID=44394 RepID=UPI003D80E667